MWLVKAHDNFLLKYAKVYNENAVLVDHIIEVQALNHLTCAITGTYERDIETIKNFIHQMEIARDEIIDSTVTQIVNF